MINSILASATKGQPEPVVGMGATFLHYSDRFPGTVTEVFKIGKATAIRVAGDSFRVLRGSIQDGSAEYGISPDWDATGGVWKFDGKRWVSVRKNPKTGRWKKTYSGNLRIGSRDVYYDPHF